MHSCSKELICEEEKSVFLMLERNLQEGNLNDKMKFAIFYFFLHIAIIQI